MFLQKSKRNAVNDDNNNNNKHVFSLYREYLARRIKKKLFTAFNFYGDHTTTDVAPHICTYTRTYRTLPHAEMLLVVEYA